MFVMHGFRQFCQRGSNYDNVVVFFFVVVVVFFVRVFLFVFVFVHEGRRGERIQYHYVRAQQ